MATTDIQISARDIPQYLCFNYNSTRAEDMTIECNNCSTGDYMFFDGKKEDQCSSDWLTNAATHIQKYHTIAGKVGRV